MTPEGGTRVPVGAEIGEDLTIAALLVSRLCHDLAAPVGAVLNGVELLRDETNDPKDSIDLVEFSATEAVRRVEFYRLAFGAAGGFGVDVPLTDLRSVTQAFFAGRKVVIDWPAGGPASLPQAMGKLLLNLVLLASEGLPRGGAVRVAVSEAAVAVTASGQGANLAPARRDALDARFQPPLDARLALPYHVGILARAAGAKLTVTEQAGQLTLHASLQP